jgi:hypothetical protein
MRSKCLTGPCPTLGGGASTDKKVLINGKIISITSNLEAALFEFRRQAPELLPLFSLERLKAVWDELQSLKEQFYEKPQRDDISEIQLATLEQMQTELRESLIEAVEDDQTTENLVDTFIPSRTLLKQNCAS